MEVWREIVARDGVKIAEALNRDLFRRYLELEFPGRPMAAKFVLSNEKKQTAEEVADLAGKLKTAGYLVDQAELEEKVGYKLEKVEEVKEVERVEDVLRRPPYLNKSTSSASSTSSTSSTDLLSAFAADTSAAGKAVAELLKKVEEVEDVEEVKEAAAALLAKLDTLLPDDPAMAAVLAEEMAKEFGLVEVANAGTSEGAKKGWETRRKNGWTPEQLSENTETVNGLISDLGKKGPDGKGKAWKNEPKDLGTINEELAAEIQKANPKMKATVGTMQTIDHAQLQHALDDHGVGKETWPNAVPITEEDLKRIPDVLSSFDDIIPGKGIAEGKKQEAVVFRKKYPDGTMCCVEIDWFRRGENRHELKFQTMWKNKLEEEK